MHGPLFPLFALRSLCQAAGCLMAIGAGAQSVDSTATRSVVLKAGSTASYLTIRNAPAQHVQHYAFSGSLFLQDAGARGGRRHQHQVLADLGYLKFVDSTWVKGTDRLLVSLLWSRNTKRWTRSLSISGYTQFMPSELLAYDATIERYGGPLVPGGLELGYGATWYPWERSSIQFACATAKVLSTPERVLQDTSARHLARTANAVIDVQYGGSVVVSIDHPLNGQVEWTNASRVFCSAFDRDHVNAELMNRFAIKLYKYVQLRLDTRLAYDPLTSYELRFSQEVVLAVLYERQHTR